MAKRYIDILDLVPLRGPNTWTYRPVIEALVDIGELEDFPSNKLPGFTERLTAWLPGLIEHRCSVGETGGFIQRLREGTWPAHILEHVTIELQNRAGMQTGFGKARSAFRPGVYKVVVRSRNEDVSRMALFAARDLIMAAIDDKPYDVAGTIDTLRDEVDSRCLGPSTACIVDAATARRIPSIRLNDGNLVQIGYGSRQRRIWTAETDRTAAIAESIASDKNLTKTLLAACGVPVPEGQVVHSLEEALEAAEDIGYPVVVKPRDGNHGRGVCIDLKTPADVEAAYPIALRQDGGVMVERHINGTEHRILVVGGRMVAAAGGERAVVIGNGKDSILDLVAAQINSDPRRGTTEEFPLNIIRADVDSAVQLELARQGFTPESVPPEGKEILIQSNGNVAFDVTDKVHPSVAAAASLAARVVGLDIAGVDLVIDDISRPIDEQKGAIVEVNAGPGLLMHLKPASGEARPVGQAIVDHLFPESENGRIPVIGITGSHGKTAVARILARMIHLSGKSVGAACSDGLVLDQRLVEKKDCATWAGGHRLLMNRALDAVVIENGPRVILGQGVAYDKCQIGIVTNFDPERLPTEFDVHNEEKMYSVLRTQVDIVLPEGAAVLNAADPLVASLAELSDGEVVYFALDAAAAPLAEHLQQGHRAVFVRNNAVVLAKGSEEIRLVDLGAIPAAHGDGAVARLETLLAAVGAAWALGISRHLMRAVLETYDPADPSGTSAQRSEKRKTRTH